MKGEVWFPVSLAAGLLAALALSGQANPPALPNTAAPPNVAALARGLREMTIDPSQTYHVRDFRLVRGDLRLYLSDGVISFMTPVGGRRVAAIFATRDSEFGDAELLVFPPRRGEREALLHFAKAPNLDEHFDSSVFLFTDGTFEEVRQYVAEHDIQSSPDLAESLAGRWNPVAQNLAADAEIRILDALVNRRPPDVGFFDAIVGGRQLGVFDVIHDRELPESVAIGQVETVKEHSAFRLWSSFVPRRHEETLPDEIHLANYRIDTQLAEDLRQTTETQFDLVTDNPRTQAVYFMISDRMQVTSASVDGAPAETYQRTSLHVSGSDPTLSPFLVVAARTLAPHVPHTFTIRAEGTVVDRAGNRGYYVSDRNAWFPHREAQLAQFDLTFHLPAHYRIVSIGDLIDEHVTASERVMHRRTRTPARYAGFNLGEYEELSGDHGPYRIECFANRDLMMRGSAPKDVDPDRVAEPDADRKEDSGKDIAAKRLDEISAKAGALLDRYSAEWGPLPIHSLAISPIPAFFGQGFPGLVYLSNQAYLHDDERQPALRNPMSNYFYSDLMLAHEVAHQWWGNLVSPTDYHSDWIFEALSNIAALDLLQQNHGISARNLVLDSFRADLLAPLAEGRTVDSVGPIELGHRLRDLANQEAWRVITYEKGTWILYMLRQRMGNQSFRRMLQNVVRDYAGRELTIEAFRQVAAAYLPPGSPDPKLDEFFESWVYGTGIPKLSLKTTAPGRSKTANRQVTVQVEGVAEDFTMDVPITVFPHSSKAETRWIRCTSDGATFEIPRDATVQLPPRDEFLYAP